MTIGGGHMPAWAQPGIHTVQGLMNQIAGGDLALPDFQRDFVWDPADAQALLVSILAQYPSGTLLFLDKGSTSFHRRSFEVAGTGRTKNSATLVLDGQQRLTALFQALTNDGEASYYVRLAALREGGLLDSQEGDASELDTVIEFRLKKTKGAKSPLNTLAEQAEQLLLPFEVIGRGEGNSWATKVGKHLGLSGDDQVDLLNQVGNVSNRILQYGFPVVRLPESTPTDAVCKIFETMNLRGVRLGVFELLTARFWPAGVDLRNLWDEAQRKHPILGAEEFNVDPYYLLQAVSILATRAKVPANEAPKASAQRSDVLKLNAQDFKAFWPKVVKGAADALKHLRSECGVLTPQLLPYSMVLVPMSAAWHLIDQSKGPAKATLRAQMTRYFWCTVFTRNYDQGGNSQAGRDYIDLERWLKGGTTAPEAVEGFQFAPELLDEAKVNLKALYRGILALSVCKGARDFHNSVKLTSDLMGEQQIDSHHVFPKAWIDTHNKANGTKYASELILNRALIDKKTNRSIGKHPPSEYITTIEKELGPAGLKRVLGSHLIPSGAPSGLPNDDYAKFIRARRKVVYEAILEVTRD